MEINAFHIYWKKEQSKRNFKPYFTLTTLLSALEWKKNEKGNLTFYMDPSTYEFFYDRNLLSAWDRVDKKTLEEEIDPNHFDTNTFFTIGKFIALKKEKLPCAMVDIDLIAWENIDDIIKNKKSAFTHYEKTTPESVSYPKKEDILKRKDYEFKRNWDFTSNALNTSFMYFNDKETRDYYVEEAMDYMKDNFTNRKKISSNPEVLFVEQRLLAMCYKDLEIEEEVTPIVDIEWDSYKGEFTKGNRIWKFFELDNNDLITHTWIAKEQIDKNKLYEDYMTIRLIEKIKEFDNDYYEVLESIEEIKPYIQLLEKYQSTKNLIKKGIVTDDLYGNKILKKKR